jgi:arginine decarboxylase
MRTEKDREQERMALVDALTAYSEKDPAYFRIPAHRFARGASPELLRLLGPEVFRYDLTEAEGLDDLHHPEGVIKIAQEQAAALYGADRTWFLVNGTTCGIEAMILAAAGPGEKIIVPRNAHKSVLMGLVLSGAVPVWVNPEYLEPWGICGPVAPEALEEAFRREPECRAALLVSPTYYGVCSDLKAAGEICHARGAMLLVDEAHGAHMYFSGRYPQGALRQGADICVQSTHKTAGSLTQSSMLHCRGNLADASEIDRSLKLVMSTSPSYLLMASLDAARHELAASGERMMERAADLAEEARVLLEKIPGISVLRDGGGRKMPVLDPARLVFSAREKGIGGYELQDRLYREYGVTVEMADWENVVAVVTWANEQEEIRKLTEAVKDLTQKTERPPLMRTAAVLPSAPPAVLTPREAWFAEKETVSWEEAEGKVAAESAAPYPPGIPLICPGEVLTPEIHRALEQYRRNRIPIHGPADPELKSFRICRQAGGHGAGRTGGKK